MTTITEADVERAALDWLSGLGWGVAHGPDIAPARSARSGTTTGRWHWSHRCGVPNSNISNGKNYP